MSAHVRRWSGSNTGSPPSTSACRLGISADRGRLVAATRSALSSGPRCSTRATPRSSAGRGLPDSPVARSPRVGRTRPRGRGDRPKAARGFYQRKPRPRRRPPRSPRRPPALVRPTTRRASSPTTSTAGSGSAGWHLPRRPRPSFVHPLRKHGGPIEHLADGTRIAEVTDTEYDDVQVAQARRSATPP